MKTKIQVSFLNPHAQSIAFTKLLSTMSYLEMAYLTDFIASLIAISASNYYYYYLMVRIPALSKYLFPFGTGNAYLIDPEASLRLPLIPSRTQGVPLEASSTLNLQTPLG